MRQLPRIIIVLSRPNKRRHIPNFVFKVVVTAKAQIKSSNEAYLVVNGNNFLMMGPSFQHKYFTNIL